MGYTVILFRITVCCGMTEFLFKYLDCRNTLAAASAFEESEYKFLRRLRISNPLHGAIVHAKGQTANDCAELSANNLSYYAPFDCKSSFKQDNHVCIQCKNYLIRLRNAIFVMQFSICDIQ